MRLVIDEKVRPYPLSLVGPHHFRSREAAEAVDPAVVLARPDTYSLYCLDHERRRAIFVETPPDVDLAAAPFYCQAQYAAATGLVAVDYDDLHAPTDRVDERRMEPTAEPRGVLAALFVHCGVPPVPAGTLDRILAEDSRAGTSISRDRVRTAAGAPDLNELAELHAVIAELSTTVTSGLVITRRGAGADRRLAQGSAV